MVLSSLLSSSSSKALSPSSIGMLEYMDFRSIVIGFAFGGTSPFSFRFSKYLRMSGVSSMKESCSLTFAFRAWSQNQEIISVFEPQPEMIGLHFGILSNFLCTLGNK